MTALAAQEIPDIDTLYYRVHANLVAQQGQLGPNVIRAKDGCLSTDWSRYSTPQESQERSGDPSKIGIIGFPVKSVRSIDPLVVKHVPLAKNRSHAHILGFDPPVSRDEKAVLKVRLRLELFACIQGGTWMVRPRLRPQ